MIIQKVGGELKKFLADTYYLSFVHIPSISIGSIIEMPVILWTYPRTVSTAFERSIYMLKDQLEVRHEPLSISYYFSSDRRTMIPGYTAMPIDTNAPTFDEQCTSVVSRTRDGKRVFVKDMAYYCGNTDQQQRTMLDSLESKRQESGGCDDEIVHTFLIRDPTKAITSLFKKQIEFDVYEGETHEEEIGILELEHLFRIVTEERGQKAIVVDADDLISNPEAIMRQYCDLSSLVFDPKMLEWGNEDFPKEWELWGAWHDAAKSGNGFTKDAPVTDTVVDEVEKKHLVTRAATTASMNSDSNNFDGNFHSIHNQVSNMNALQEAYDKMYDQRIRIPISV